MMFRCQGSMMRTRPLAGSALSPFARPDGSCLGRQPEEESEDSVPVPKGFQLRAFPHHAGVTQAKWPSTNPERFSQIVRTGMG